MAELLGLRRIAARAGVAFHLDHGESVLGELSGRAGLLDHLTTATGDEATA